MAETIEITIEPKSFNDFYLRVKEKVINLLKEKEISEGNICFEKIVGAVFKELMLENGDIKRKQIIPRDQQNYPTKNILYRDDSKIIITKEQMSIK